MALNPEFAGPCFEFLQANVDGSGCELLSTVIDHKLVSTVSDFKLGSSVWDSECIPPFDHEFTNTAFELNESKT